MTYYCLKGTIVVRREALAVVVVVVYECCFKCSVRQKADPTKPRQNDAAKAKEQTTTISAKPRKQRIGEQ